MRYSTNSIVFTGKKGEEKRKLVDQQNIFDSFVAFTVDNGDTIDMFLYRYFCFS